MILKPIPQVGTSYTTTLYTATFITSVTLISGTLPPGLSTSFTSTNVTLSGTPTTSGNYNFTLRISRTFFGNFNLQFSTYVAEPPLPASGAIKFSDIGSKIGISGPISASNVRFKTLANGVDISNPVSVSNTKSKPVRGSQNIIATSTTWTVPAYQTMIIIVSGAGGGGGVGRGNYYNTSLFSCLPNDFEGSTGDVGSQSSIFEFTAYGGKGGDRYGNSGDNGGNSVNSTLGGGSKGGTGFQGSYQPGLCNPYTGGSGGEGGSVEIVSIIDQGQSPEYSTSTIITGGKAGGNGSDGYVYIEWA